MVKLNFKIFNIILIILILILLIVIILSLWMPEVYKVAHNCQNCSIGKIEVAGDYTCQESLNPLNYFNCRDMAIKDCNAYNKYQELIIKYQGEQVFSKCMV